MNKHNMLITAQGIIPSTQAARKTYTKSAQTYPATNNNQILIKHQIYE
jgi:hypothetical protein